MSDNNTKDTISARLRRWADESEALENNSYPSIGAVSELGINLDSSWAEERALFRRIADEVDAELSNARNDVIGEIDATITQLVERMARGEIYDTLTTKAIERYYLPRPLFSDGEPVRVGDYIKWKHGSRMVTGISAGLFTYTLNLSGGLTETMPVDMRLMRPEPEPVLDADGVPIEVGKVGWLTNLNYPVKVRVEEIRGDSWIRVLHLDDDPNWDEHILTRAENFTRTEPDSLERLRDDIRDYLDACSDEYAEVRGWADRLTALMGSDA